MFGWLLGYVELNGDVICRGKVIGGTEKNSFEVGGGEEVNLLTIFNSEFFLFLLRFWAAVLFKSLETDGKPLMIITTLQKETA